MACEDGYKAQDRFNEAILARISAEANLMTGRDRFNERWDRFTVAKDAWATAVHDRYFHIANCPDCYTKPPR